MQGLDDKQVWNAHTSEASIKVLTVKILFDFHKLRSSLFGRTDRLGSSMRSAEFFNLKVLAGLKVQPKFSKKIATESHRKWAKARKNYVKNFSNRRCLRTSCS